MTQGELRFGHLPDQVIPAGQASDLTAADHSDWMRQLDAMHSRLIYMNLRGRVVKAGKGEVVVGILPDQNPEAGQVGYRYHLVIDPPLVRPLRAHPSAQSHDLRPLAGDSHWVAMAVSDRAPGELVDLAQQAFARLASSVPSFARIRTTVYRTGGRTPTTGDVKAAGYVGGKR